MGEVNSGRPTCEPAVQFSKPAWRSSRGAANRKAGANRSVSTVRTVSVSAAPLSVRFWQLLAFLLPAFEGPELLNRICFIFLDLISLIRYNRAY